MDREKFKQAQKLNDRIDKLTSFMCNMNNKTNKNLTIYTGNSPRNPNVVFDDDATRLQILVENELKSMIKETREEFDRL